MSSNITPRHKAEEQYSEAVNMLAEGNATEAAQGFRAALEFDPDFLDALHGLIHALRDCGEYDRAIAASHELIARDPDDILAHTSLSILYQHKGMVPEAEAEALKTKLLGWKQELREARNTEST
jgi:tetratricopeptide (TPR) repeat protein